MGKLLNEYLEQDNLPEQYLTSEANDYCCCCDWCCCCEYCDGSREWIGDHCCQCSCPCCTSWYSGYNNCCDITVDSPCCQNPCVQSCCCCISCCDDQVRECIFIQWWQDIVCTSCCLDCMHGTCCDS